VSSRPDFRTVCANLLQGPSLAIVRIVSRSVPHADPPVDDMSGAAIATRKERLTLEEAR
jgi:hypothetical protein